MNNASRSFWSYPLGWPHAVVLAGSLLIIGILIGLCSGSAAVAPLKWPFNLIAFGGIVAIASLVMWIRGRHQLLVWLSSIPIFISSVAAIGIISLVMAVFPSNLARSWPFALSLLLLIINMVTCIIRNTFIKRQFDARFVLSHLGVLIIIVGMAFGVGDQIKAKMQLSKDVRSSVAVTEGAFHFRLPFSLTLKEFSMIGSPEKSNYRSVVDVEGEGAKHKEAVIEVNHPLQLQGWHLYQYSHADDVSIIEAVYDPWMKAVYAGIYMLLAGAIMMLWRRAAT